MRKAWIDLGSHIGDVTRKFMASRFYTPEFELHAFEANPFMERRFRHYPPEVTIHRCAAWINDGQTPLYVNPSFPRNRSASLCADKLTGGLSRKHPVIVDCCDFSRWLDENFQPDDYLIVKSNIEGAEYPVFAQLVETGKISYINRLYLLCHAHKLELAVYKKLHRRLMSTLQRIDGLEVLAAYDF